MHLVPQPDDEIISLLTPFCNNLSDFTRGSAYSALLHYWDAENSILRELMYNGAFGDFYMPIRRMVRYKLQEIDPRYPTYFKKFLCKIQISTKS